jgi:putative protease
MEQIGPVLGCGVRSVLVDFPDVRRCREAVETIRQAGARVFLATPRIQKPGEERVFRTLAGFGPDGLLVRNLGGLGFCRGEGIPAVADSSLNAANELTVHWLHQQGALRVTAAYDLDRGQIADLAATVPPEWLEVVVYQHVPMFHTEHCIFCAVLSSGTDRTNCGQPCRRHEVRLRDPAGMEHPVAAEYGCRNTVYSAAAQESAELVPALLQRGVGHFRVEFLEGTGPHEVEHVVRRYRRLTDCPSQP